jgi:putative oxidoreductase
LKFLNSLQPLSFLLLRLALGIIFFVYGYPKLTHANGTMQTMFVQHGLPAQLVYVSGVLETFGGLLLILGLFARGAALLLAIEMCVATLKVHMMHGVMGLHDYQFPLVLAVACFTLATVGAGSVSVDSLLLGEGSSARSRSGKSARK